MSAHHTPPSGTRVGLSATDFAVPVLGGLRVLVVEQDADTAATLTALLRLNGFAAHAAHTGAEALTAVDAAPPSAVIIDLDLPDADGCDVIRWLLARSTPPVVVVLTGHTDPGHRRAAAGAGAAEYLLKPADPVGLVRLLMRLCATREGS